MACELDTYNLFVELEYEAKKALRLGKDINEENLKNKFLDAISTNDDIKFKWTLLSAEMSEEAVTF